MSNLCSRKALTTQYVATTNNSYSHLHLRTHRYTFPYVAYRPLCPPAMLCPGPPTAQSCYLWAVWLPVLLPTEPYATQSCFFWDCIPPSYHLLHHPPSNHTLDFCIWPVRPSCLLIRGIYTELDCRASESFPMRPQGHLFWLGPRGPLLYSAVRGGFEAFGTNMPAPLSSAVGLYRWLLLVQPSNT